MTRINYAQSCKNILTPANKSYLYANGEIECIHTFVSESKINSQQFSTMLQKNQLNVTLLQL
jgi:hypothetical protein